MRFAGSTSPNGWYAVWVAMVTELALASRTGWLDLSRRDWWPEGLAWSRATPELMPLLVEAGMPVGQITRSDTHPRLRSAVLTVAGHDHQAAAVGVGATGEGDEVDSCGTARPSSDPSLHT